MKQILRIASLILLTGVAVAPANAQMSGTKVKVPFNFMIGEKTFVAGQYLAAVSGDKVQIQDSKGLTVAVVLSDALGGKVPDHNGKAVFDCYAERCFLKQVWVVGQDAGRGLPKSKFEISLAQEGRKKQEFALLMR